MPNPRYILIGKRSGLIEPSVEMLKVLTQARRVYHDNLGWFCDKWTYPIQELQKVTRVYLIGSHANESGWKNETSDIDLKLVLPDATPDNLHRYKREVLDPLLHQGEKRRWIDLFFAREDYQVTDPKWDLTEAWSRINLDEI